MIKKKGVETIATAFGLVAAFFFGVCCADAFPDKNNGALLMGAFACALWSVVLKSIVFFGSEDS
jgi:hypothetical protein